MSRRTWLSLGGVTAIMAIALILTHQPGNSPIPSATNPGPRGVEIARVWLEELGVDARLGQVPLTNLPADVATLVLPAPELRPFEDAEADAVMAFLERGGTLLYLVGRESLVDPLARRLAVRHGPLLPMGRENSGLDTSVRVSAQDLPGVHELSLAALDSVKVASADAVSVSEPAALWRLPVGRGVAWIAAGPELLDNAHLHRADNAALLRAVAGKGPVWFDEYHHVSAGPAPVARSLTAAMLQVLFALLLLLLGIGRRLGPARATPVHLHRSAIEYVDAFAALTRRARVDAALADDVRRRQAASWAQRFGLPSGLGEDELTERVAAALRRDPAEVRAALAERSLPGLLRALDALGRPSPQVPAKER